MAKKFNVQRRGGAPNKLDALRAENSVPTVATAPAVPFDALPKHGRGKTSKRRRKAGRRRPFIMRK